MVNQSWRWYRYKSETRGHVWLLPPSSMTSELSLAFLSRTSGSLLSLSDHFCSRITHQVHLQNKPAFVYILHLKRLYTILINSFWSKQNNTVYKYAMWKIFMTMLVITKTDNLLSAWIHCFVHRYMILYNIIFDNICFLRQWE